MNIEKLTKGVNKTSIVFYRVSERLPPINADFKWYKKYLCIESNGNESICYFEPWSWAREVDDSTAQVKTIMDSQNNLLVKEKPEGEGWELRYCFREASTNFSKMDVVAWADLSDLFNV